MPASTPVPNGNALTGTITYTNLYNEIFMNMKQFAAALMICFASANMACAQSFIGDLKTKKNGQGTVTVTQSKEIDELVDKARLVKSTPATPQTAQHHDNTAAAHQQGQNKTADGAAPREQHAAPRTAPDTEQPTANANTGKKVMRNSKKVMGYRVQVFSGGNSGADKQKAERIGSSIKQLYPELPVYVHFYSPRWICRVGNFRTYQEAANVLKNIKSMGYPQACIVKGKISVPSY